MMTTDEVKTTVKKHRWAAILGGAAGLVVLLGWVGYEIATTPTQPIIETAPAAEVVAYISNARGLSKLSQIEQERFLERWTEHVARPENRQALKTCFDELEGKERKAFTDAISKHLKRGFMDEARQFAALSDQAEQNDFLRKKLAEGHERITFIKEVAGAFRGDLGGREEFNQWVLEHTTPKEQALGERYVEALKRVALQVKREDRSSG